MFACMKPPDNPAVRDSKLLDAQIKQDYKKFEKTIKLLLLGTGESGKTTILKQMKILHINGFSLQEKKDIIPFIKQNIHESIYAIVSNAGKINPPVIIEDEYAKISAEFILRIGPQKPESWNQDYVNHIKVLWKDRNIQEIYSRSNEYQLIDSTEHFLERIEDVNKEDYVPTVQDILYCRIMTVAITKINFQINNVPFCIFDVGGQRGHRKKWISVFEGINSILFLIAASDFDQNLREDETVNRLTESFNIFEEMYKSRFLREAAMIVFLNKQDVLQKKIQNGKKIEKYFPDYINYVPTKLCDSEYDKVKYFVRQKIIDITKAQENEEIVYIVKGMYVKQRIGDREVYIHFTIATDTNNIKHVFDDVQDLIFKGNVKAIF